MFERSDMMDYACTCKVVSLAGKCFSNPVMAKQTCQPLKMAIE